ncbi:MAG TPA: DUF4097 family beta strand repeat-containing protein [Thermoanaerobaculia bacterium]|nr:DUF4097 family beta strand repeat-containing protein [Thermoanaerobaculia bacterium]
MHARMPWIHRFSPRPLPALLIGLLALVGSSCVLPAAVTVSERSDQTYSLRAGGALSVKNVNGAVTVEAWDRDEVHVEAVKKAQAGSDGEARRILRQIKIEVREEAGRLIVETRMPGHNGLLDWLAGEGQRQASVEYHLQVPRRLDLDAETVNGGLRLSGIKGAARLASTNGAIDVAQVDGRLRLQTTNGGIKVSEAAGEVRAETTNGSVNAQLNRVDGTLSFETTNGHIDITLPRDVRASIEAETANGNIHTDFAVAASGQTLRRRLHGDINGGGGKLVANTTNGGIRIRSS